MKRLLFMLFVLALILPSLALAGFIDHPRYSHLVTQTEAFVTAVAAKQADYYLANGRYFQGIRVPGGEIDGTADVSINVDIKPHDQDESWFQFDKNLFKKNMKVPYHIWIDVYAGPDGSGWTISGEFFFPGLGPDAYGNVGDHWRYRHHEGPAIIGGILDEWYVIPEGTE